MKKCILLEPKSAVKAFDTSTAAGDRLVYSIPFKCNLREIQLHVGNTEATAYVMALDKRVLAGSDSGRVEIDRISLPASNVQGKVYYVDETDFDRIELQPGDELVVETITASTATKAASVEILVDYNEELDANLSDKVRSA